MNPVSVLIVDSRCKGHSTGVVYKEDANTATLLGCLLSLLLTPR